MILRTMTGIVVTAVVYLVIAYSYIPQVLFCALSALSVAAIVEIFQVTGSNLDRETKCGLVIGSVIISFLSIPKYEIFVCILLPLTVMAFIWIMVKQKDCSFDKKWKTVLIAIIVVLLFKAAVPLRQITNGLYYLLMAVTVSFVTDVMAYLVGSHFGKHKLIPKVSPNKTVEGAVAGIIGSVLTMILFGWYWISNGKGSCEHIILYAISASIAGQFGDLAMSAVKRISSVKDFGTVLPGHGGILDRFDSHLFCIAYTLLFCVITGGYLV